MPIPLGILAAAGVRAAGGSYELIETITVGSGGAASVTFSNLNTYSTTYQHLQIRAVARTSQSGTARAMAVRLNADTATNYAWHILDGDGSTVNSRAGTSTDFMYLGQTTASGSTANAFGASVIDILDPYEVKNKTLRSLAGAHTGGVNFIRLMSGFRNNTASVTSVTLLAEDLASNFAAGSRFSIYGLKAS